MQMLSSLIVATALSMAGSANPPCAHPCIAKVPLSIERYFEGLERVSRAGSNEDDIERILELFTVDGRYVHVDYEADFDIESWRAAFLRNLNRGAYANGPDDCIVITNHIPGNETSAIEYTHGTNVDGACAPKDDERLLAVFYMKGDKIRRVEELW